MPRVGTLDGTDHWKSLFALIRNHLPRLELSIQLCIAEGRLVLLYQAEHKDGEEEFEHDFDVGGNHESWTTAIQAVEASHWPLLRRTLGHPLRKHKPRSHRRIYSLGYRCWLHWANADTVPGATHDNLYLTHILSPGSRSWKGEVGRDHLPIGHLSAARML